MSGPGAGGRGRLAVASCGEETRRRESREGHGASSFFPFFVVYPEPLSLARAVCPPGDICHTWGLGSSATGSQWAEPGCQLTRTPSCPGSQVEETLSGWCSDPACTYLLASLGLAVRALPLPVSPGQRAALVLRVLHRQLPRLSRHSCAWGCAPAGPASRGLGPQTTSVFSVPLAPPKTDSLALSLSSCFLRPALIL